MNKKMGKKKSEIRDIVYSKNELRLLWLTNQNNNGTPNHEHTNLGSIPTFLVTI